MSRPAGTLFDGPIHFDASRLIARGVRSSPTGIDRVDLAYARHLLDTGADLRPVAWLGGTLRTVEPAALAAYLQRLAGHWNGGTAADRAGPVAGEARIAGFLRGERVARYRPPTPPSPFGRLVRQAVGTAGGLADRTLTRDGFKPRPVFRPGPAGGTYLNVSHHHLEKPALFAALGPAPQTVIFVHDLIPIDHPEYCRPGDDAKHRARMRNVVAHADRVLVNSAFTADRLQAFAATCGKVDLPVTVAPLGIDRPPPADAAPFPAARPYFVTVGTIEARKNHLLLLNIWRRLAETLGPDAPRLVVIGRRGWEIEAVIDMLERSPPLEDTVLETGPVGDCLLARLMAGARALLMPSFTEGFGLPVAEALAAGVPVIASDIPAHREIAGTVPELLDPLDGPAWIRAVTDYAADPSDRRAAQTARMADYRAPDWARHFRLAHI
ncbi:glycosyltransferase family 4 protein [Prosthecodimorpha staleyi]|uniref:Glycosyltransferase family 4 protein n=1 Tax=Prosthecodimorpha staleyi TaxID=2840188 RepID=A0A947GGF4_9HYPH|nr:glycosyltransferase family 1 protein [Prosthecodimorpha staleyi]MBT9292085.1 glycosyltransferase family 4 protein [Prosthecodimorpha staleyi]